MYVYRSDCLYCIIIIFIFLIVSYLASCMGFPLVGWSTSDGVACRIPGSFVIIVYSFPHKFQFDNTTQGE